MNLIAIHAVLLILLLLTVVLLLFNKSMIENIIILNIFSLLIASIYLMMNAPDVAITETAVGVGLSTIFFLLALRRSKFKNSTSSNSLLATVLIIPFGILLGYAILDIPPFGDANSAATQGVVQYYIENTNSFMGFSNIVTAILASFRGYDTFGETVVVFTAAISILLLIGRDDNV